MKTNTVIIGSGIAGMTAALYLKRSNIDLMLIEKSSPGGQVLTTSTIENYPGTISIDGPQFAINVYKQMNSLNVEYLYTDALGVELKDNEKIVKTDKGDIICKNIIIATGRRPRTLQLPNIEKFVGKGISYCAICDASLYKNKKVAVVGAGNSAYEEAIYLSKICSEVTIIARSEQHRADSSLKETAKNIQNIKIISNKELIELTGNDKLESIIYIDTLTKEKTTLKIDGLFIYIGQDPNTDNFKNLNIIDNYGYINVDQNMETKISGIFAAGDCVSKNVYQIITAASDGAVAATIIAKRI